MKGKVGFIPGAHKIEFHEYDVPEPPAGGLIAEVTQTNVCGSEVHMWKGEFGKRGIMPGHEMSGVVHSLGKGVKTDLAGKPVKEGDRIAPVYYTVCNRCANCVAGHHSACTAKTVGARHPDEAPHFTCTFATHYWIKPEQHFYRVPDNVPDLIASSANCAMSQVYWGLDRGRVAYGENLVVLGAGGLGLHAMAIAKARGAYVIAIDGVEHRLDEAKQFGADDTIDLRKHPEFDERQAQVAKLCGGWPDVVLEVAGVPEAFIDAMKMVSDRWPGDRGRQHLARPATPDSAFDGDVQVAGDHRRGDVSAALSKEVARLPLACISIVIHTAQMCDATFPLSKAAEAMDKSERREVTRAGLLPRED